MMYCSTDEAYNDNNITKQPKIIPSFFTAQGDYSPMGPYFDLKNNNNQIMNDQILNGQVLNDQIMDDQRMDNQRMNNQIMNDQKNFQSDDYQIEGTLISDLQEKDNNSFDESLSYLDSKYTSGIGNDSLSDLYESEKKGKKIYTHKYYIDKFVNNIINDKDEKSDIMSLASSIEGTIYAHIKSCKYCRSKINERLKNHYKKIKKKNKVKKNDSILENFGSIDKFEILGYEIKDIILIMMLGIIIIFVLDLFVKIGRKTIKKKIN